MACMDLGEMLSNGSRNQGSWGMVGPGVSSGLFPPCPSNADLTPHSACNSIWFQVTFPLSQLWVCTGEACLGVLGYPFHLGSWAPPGWGSAPLTLRALRSGFQAPESCLRGMGSWGGGTASPYLQWLINWLHCSFTQQPVTGHRNCAGCLGYGRTNANTF